jgi:hypothetical protein
MAPTKSTSTFSAHACQTWMRSCHGNASRRSSLDVRPWAASSTLLFMSIDGRRQACPLVIETRTAPRQLAPIAALPVRTHPWRRRRAVWVIALLAAALVVAVGTAIDLSRRAAQSSLPLVLIAPVTRGLVGAHQRRARAHPGHGHHPAGCRPPHPGQRPGGARRRRGGGWLRHPQVDNCPCATSALALPTPRTNCTSFERPRSGCANPWYASAVCLRGALVLTRHPRRSPSRDDDRAQDRLDPCRRERQAGRASSRRPISSNCWSSDRAQAMPFDCRLRLSQSDDALEAVS